MKKLYLSDIDKKVSGVCGGIGEYFEVDPNLIRLAWILLSIFSAGFPGLIAYIIAAAIIPRRWSYKASMQEYSELSNLCIGAFQRLTLMGILTILKGDSILLQFTIFNWQSVKIYTIFNCFNYKLREVY